MFTKTALLAVGMIVIGSASLAAQQKNPPAKKTEPQKPVATTPVAERHFPAGMWTAEQIKQLQIDLAALKLYDGKPTGSMNTDTEEALKKFQREHDMAPTGMMSDSLLVRLHRATMHNMHNMHDMHDMH